MKIATKFLISALVALFAVACGGDDGPTPPPVPDDTNCWELTSWGGSTALAGKVYLQLDDDKTFALYQNINTPGFQKFTGNYAFRTEGEKEVLTGTYSDGEAWKYSYEVVSRTETNLTLKSVGEGVVSEYKATKLPDWVKDGVTDDGSRAVTERFL